MNERVIPAAEVGHILNEALPYIHRFAGQTMVVKYGGNAMTDAALQQSFARNIALMKAVGMNPIVVHGGGPQIAQMLDALGKSTRFIDGLRVTDAETMRIVEMVLGAHVNKQVVSLINQAGGRAVGITGKDGQSIIARPFASEQELGFVGEVDHINPELIRSLEHGGFIPVIAPIGVDAQGNSYNINADLVASKVAMALNAHKLLLLTNTPGILDREGRLLTGLTRADIQGLIDEGTIYGGMLPKVACALESVEAGVEAVQIIDGRVDNALLLELFTNAGVGTLIR